MANAKRQSDDSWNAIKTALAIAGAKDVHVASRGRHCNDEPFFFDDGKPCAVGWFEVESDARTAQEVFRDDLELETRVIRDGNAGREWFWLAVR